MELYEKHATLFPRQLSSKTIRTGNLENLKKGSFDSVVIVGMGGSGAVGTAFENTAAAIGLRCPVSAVKNYRLPETVSKNPLFIFVSFSGDTEETLAAADEALKKIGKKNVALVTSGGNMKRIAGEKRLAFAAFSPGDLTPREASGIMYYGVFKILEAAFEVRIPKFTLATPASLARLGKKIAGNIDGNIIIYSQNELSHVSTIWKNNFNETGKNAAFMNTYPEMNHNEIEGFGHIEGRWTVILLDDFKRFAKKKDFLVRELKEKKISTLEIAIPGKGIFEKTWNGIMLSHFTSFFLAKRHKKNPTEVDVIRRLKQL